MLLLCLYSRNEEIKDTNKHKQTWGEGWGMGWSGRWDGERVNNYDGFRGGVTLNSCGYGIQTINIS